MAENRTIVLFVAIVPGLFKSAAGSDHGQQQPTAVRHRVDPAHRHQAQAAAAYHRGIARVTELVDVAGLKPAAFGRTGSIPVLRTTRAFRVDAC